jgi:tyrosine-protein kinase Etk/Wzc
MDRQSTYRAEYVVSEEEPIYPPDQEDNPILLLSLLRVLGRSRRTLLLFTSAGLIIGVIVAFLLPVHYTSTASFLPPGANTSSGAAVLAGQLSQLSGLGGGAGLLGAAKTPGDLYVGILKSRSIASELVKRFDLEHVYKVKKESQAEKLLASHSTFDVGIKDSIVTIAVTDESPSRARDLANAYLDALRETNSRLALSEASQRRLFFGQQLAKEKDDLEDAEVDLKRTEEQTGLIAPAGQTASEIQTIAQTRAQISVRQVELSALRQSATEQNPEVVRLQSEIADLQGQLSRLQSGSAQGAGTAIPTSKVPALALDYVRKDREVKYHEALFDMLARQYESARLDEAHEAPMLQILDPASYPDSKSGPPRMLIALGGLLLGLFAGCAGVLLRDRLAGPSSTAISPVRAE